MEKKEVLKNTNQVNYFVELWRELEIIGEATNRILKIDSTIDISNARRIVDLRNFVIHAYDSVDDVIIWGILIKDLPLLKEQVQNKGIKN